MSNTTSTHQTNATKSQSNEISRALNAMLKGNFSQWSLLESAIRAAARYSRNHRLIQGLANNACESVKDAVDSIVAEIKINLFKNDRHLLRSLASLGDNQIRQYLSKCVYNYCVSAIRTSSHDILSYCPVYEEGSGVACADEGLADDDNIALLFRLIDHLPRRQRKAVTVWLRYEDAGLGYREMAAKAGVSKTAFGKSLHLAKSALAASVRQTAPPAR